MIAPGSPADLNAEELRRLVDEFFRPGGRLSKAQEKGGFAYEPRPQQRQMALAVADALSRGRHLAIEAGTGVGKSFAYLVPLIHAAKMSAAQAVVSTYTISLQEQLIRKDLPFLQQHLGTEFKATLVKGRGNYLCLRRLARAEVMGTDFFRPDLEAELRRIRAWSRTAKEGSLQELEIEPHPEVWDAVNVEHGNCMGNKCPEFRPCFLFKARREMQDADLLIVNHHLFFSDLALRSQKAGILPDCKWVVLDEAHMLEQVASDHLGLRLSPYQLDHWLRRIYVPDTSKGLLAVLRRGQETKLVIETYKEASRFFKTLHEWAGLGPERKTVLVREPPAIETNLPGRIKAVCAALKNIHEQIEDPDMCAELAAARRRGEELVNTLSAFLSQSLEDSVYWIALEGTRRPQPVLYSAPIEVGPILAEQLFGGYSSVVMTSATLAVDGRLDYFVQRVGAERCDVDQVGSPFDYERQMRVLIPKNMPDPSETESFLNALVRAVRHFVHLSKGRAFVLFTAERAMRAVAKELRSEFEASGYELLVQGEGLSRGRMLERFRSSEAGVLFGLDSFWMGVDVRGDALSNVIITKLPFAVPDEPLVKARMDRIAEKGGDPFRDYSLPEAILKFRQGVGRLIRSQTDEGIVVILDPRIITKWYGRHFLASIPKCPVERISF